MLGDFKHEHFTSVGSTHDIAREFAQQLVSPEPFVITADCQTGGRGTHGRTWYSPFGVNLYVTYGIPLVVEKLDKLVNVPQVTAYAVIKTLEKYDLKPKFKWINDVLINRKKIAGILCSSESLPQFENYQLLLISIGLNINMSQEECSGINQPVTSMKVELGRDIHREGVLQTLCHEFRQVFNDFLKMGFGHFVESIAEHMEFRGEFIRIQQDDAKISLQEGVLLGIDAMGMLLLENEKGVERVLNGRIVKEYS